MSTEKQNRNFTLDIMRALGLFLIILAHCQPPNILFQLRSFDVPLMVVVSAATFAMLYQNKTIHIKSFYIKRIKQLILPAWYFLTFFFGSIFLGSYLLDSAYPFSINEIISSYLLYWGIGYVWILRIFLFIAILTPPLLYYKKKVNNNYLYGGIALVTYAAYEIFALQIHNILPEGNILFFIDTVLLPIVPYACLYVYGLRLQEMSNKFLIATSIICFIIFASLGVFYYQANGEFIGTFYFKYPPQLYFLSFSIVGINATYLFIKNFYPKNLFQSCWTWVSENSLWIYLWHIYAIFIWDSLFVAPEKDIIISSAKYAFVLCLSILITKAQVLTWTYCKQKKP